MPMQITLSFQPADEMWGKNAVLSFSSEQAIIHVKNDEKNNRTLVTQSAVNLN